MVRPAAFAQPWDATPGNPYQRGPDPTVAMIDTTLGTWGAVAIVPGYSALFANEEAWMGRGCPRSASW